MEEKKIILGDSILYCGDAMEILPRLKHRADCIVSDPPYKLTSGGGT